MHLLYLDDSGSADNKNEEYLVLGGICLFESQVHYVTAELDRIADRYRPSGADAVEFHASVVFLGAAKSRGSPSKKRSGKGLLKKCWEY